LKRTNKWHVQILLARRQKNVLKRWLRHAENLNDEGKKSSRDLIDFQVGNEKRSVDLLNFQECRGETPIFQVGKGEEMILAKSSCQQGVVIDGEETE
jgi:hypothetical protein